MEQQQQMDPRKMEMLLKMLEAEQQNRAISQSDGVTVYQSEGNAPGVYIDQYQKSQDAYNQALLQEQQSNAYQQQQNMYYAPPKADAFDTDPTMYAMGNPNYKTVEEGGNVTVNSNGDIIRY